MLKRFSILDVEFIVEYCVLECPLHCDVVNDCEFIFCDLSVNCVFDKFLCIQVLNVSSISNSGSPCKLRFDVSLQCWFSYVR